MKYLHASPVESHGALRSSCCVIDSRWVLKVGSVGLHWLRHSDDDDDDHTVADDQSESFSWQSSRLLCSCTLEPCSSLYENTSQNVLRYVRHFQRSCGWRLSCCGCRNDQLEEQRKATSSASPSSSKRSCSVPRPTRPYQSPPQVEIQFQRVSKICYTRNCKI